MLWNMVYTSLNTATTALFRFRAMMKISVITDISVFQFYRYIEYIGDISVDILKKNIGKLKIVKNS